MKTITDAILSINPSAIVLVKENIIDDVDTAEITWLENTPEISKADIKVKLAELKTAEADAKAQKEVDAQSGNQKLLDLGLTQAEATALTGYTPPTEV